MKLIYTAGFLTDMIKPIPFFVVAFIVLVGFNASAQTSPATCKEFKVETKVSPSSAGDSNGKISLEYASGLNYRDFRVFIFGRNRKNNQLDLTTTQITGLEKGTYTVVIQNKSDQTFCTKQLTLKVE